MEARARLLTMLRERSFQRRSVTLASGRGSNWFVDCKQSVLSAEGHSLVGELLLETLEALPLGAVDRPAAVAGVALGGCSLASAVALISYQRGRPLDALYVRKAAKDHGTTRLIEGDDRLADGTAVVMLEDAVTTGGSTLAAVEVLRARRLRVVGVVAIVDRTEGGRGAIEQAGLVFSTLFDRSDFMPDDEAADR
jgi:orotate phosphoribosyltransferase